MMCGSPYKVALVEKVFHMEDQSSQAIDNLEYLLSAYGSGVNSMLAALEAKTQT